MPTSRPSPLVSVPRRAPVALLVGDREWPLAALAPALSDAGYTVMHAPSAAAARALHATIGPELLFVDVPRPSQRPHALAMLRGVAVPGDAAAATAVVAVTSEPLAPSELLAVLEAGAWDVVAVPCDLAPLLVRCARWRRAKQAADRYREAAGAHPATRMHTAAGLRRLVLQAGAVAARTRHPISCVVLGVALHAAPGEGGRDAVVDGWVEGDDPLGRTVAAAWAPTMRAGDALGRLGAHEFALLAPGADERGAELLATRLVRAAADALTVACRGRFDGLRAALRVGARTVVPLRWDARDAAALVAGASEAAERAAA